MSSTRLIPLILLVLLFAGCSRSGPTAESNEDRPSKTFWQLEDDSELQVEVKPWPPTGGKATVEARSGIGDWGGSKPKVESVEYRVVRDPRSSEPYKRMSRTEKTEGEGEEAATVHIYSAPDVSFSSGTSWIQFKVKGTGFQREVELSDWSVNAP